ncbi:MAG: tetratricopeptide repeat protein, partial [Balneolaceae bacterium]|nr:tetratricopeptide repeat protein [Balneolaceae bacterium]
MSIFSFLLVFPPVLHAGQQLQDDTFDEALRLFYLKEYDDAYSILVQITEEACNETEKANLCVRAKTTRANIYRNRRDFTSAEDIIDRALSVSNASNTVDESSFINIYIQKSYLLLETSELQEAFEWAEQALIYTEEHSIYGPIRARAFLLRGRLFHGDGNFSEAITDYAVAQEILKSSERTLEVITMLTQLHNNIGISYRRLGNINQAMEHYQTNLSLVRETFGENHLELGYAYNSIGTVYYVIGDFATAGDHFERSASVFRSYLGENSSRYLAALNNAGLSYVQLGDLSKASTVLERAQRLKENTLGHTHPETATGYINLAHIYSQIDEFDNALKNFELGISVLTAHYGENHPNLVSSYSQFGNFYRVINEFELSRVQYRNAIHIIETRIGTSHPDIWDITRRIGSSYLEEQRYSDAIRYFGSSIQQITEDSGFQLHEQIEFDAISHPIEFLRALKGMGDANLMKYRNDENPDHLDTAQFHYELAADIVEYLQTRYQSEASKLSLIEDNYGIFSNTIELFYHRYENSNDESWLERMFEWSERSRSRIAIELLQDLDARNFADVPQDILDEERQLNQVITDLYRSLQREQERGFDADESVTSAYRDSLFYAKQQLQNFTQQLETDYPSYFYLRYDTNPANLSLAQSQLTDDETLISYLFTEDKLFALLIDHSGISAVDLGTNSEIPETIELLRNTVLSGQTDQFSNTSIRLYEKLIAPLKDKLSTNRLMIVPDQSLHFLPFELLLTGADAGRYHQMPFLIRD